MLSSPSLLYEPTYFGFVADILIHLLHLFLPSTRGQLGNRPCDLFIHCGGMPHPSSSKSANTEATQCPLPTSSPWRKTIPLPVPSATSPVQSSPDLWPLQCCAEPQCGWRLVPRPLVVPRHFPVGSNDRLFSVQTTAAGSLRPHQRHVIIGTATHCHPQFFRGKKAGSALWAEPALFFMAAARRRRHG